ncbi:MAG: ABC transporter permease subunit [Tissierella sp.]|uniref:ABC transporter permease subunit n=1 Tax=Tissierella sp. TaxID=41274 RepID=UPI003F99CAE1
MNVFIQEFNMKKRSTLIWSLSIGAFLIFYMAFFPSMSKDSSALESLMESFPEEMLQVLGLREGLSIASLMGYFTLTFTMAQVAIAVQSANYGFSILTMEERELTADFLMTKPVSRSKVYFSKFFASLLSLIITAIIISIASFISLELFSGGESYNIKNVLKLFLTIPIFQLLFLSLGMFISLLFKKIRSVLSFSMGLSIGLYVINTVREIVNSDILGFFTPFYYFEPGSILKGNYDLKLMIISFGLIGASLIFSFFIYNRKDIDSV